VPLVHRKRRNSDHGCHVDLTHRDADTVGKIFVCEIGATGSGGRDYDHDDLLRADRSDPDDRGVFDIPQPGDRMLNPYRSDRARRGCHDVPEPAFDPEPSIIVEVADIPTAMPPLWL
jgi:hypothetical protein